MKRRNYRDDPNPRGRIDARPPSEYTVKGFRNLQHDISGNVVGGTDASGKPFGSFNRARGKGSLGNPATPGLDENDRMNGRLPAVDAANLAGRQSLHADMVKAGGGGITPEMEQRAAKLGVSGSSFRRVAGGIPRPPAAIPTNATPSAGSSPVLAGASPAVATAKPSPAIPMTAVQSGMVPSKPTVATGPQRINRLTGKPFGYLPGDPTAVAKAPSSLAKTAQAAADVGKILASRPQPTAPPATAPQPAVAAPFAVPPANDFHPVSSQPAALATTPAAPVSEFQSLTTPTKPRVDSLRKSTAGIETQDSQKPGPAWKQPMTTTKSQPTARFVGNTPAMPAPAQRVATSQAAAAKNPNNKPTPSWLQGTAAGNTLEWLSKQRL